MRLSILTLFQIVTTTKAFTISPAFKTTTKLYSTVEDTTTDPKIIITGNNIELTEALSEYVNRKLESPLSKVASNGYVREVDVHMSVIKNPKVESGNKCEVVARLKGTTIRTSEESSDMYSSIDLVADRLSRKLKQYKERKTQGYHGGPAIGENMADVINKMDENDTEGTGTEEEFIDPEAPKVTKIKSFDLSNSITVEEAIFALDYIDHDFYVFRDEDTKEISVVYKRNAGGVGLIQPQQ